MADSFDLAYLYGRVCGSFSETFLGARGVSLAALTDIRGLWKAVLGDEPPDLPEALLLKQAEHRVLRRAFERFDRLAAPFTEGDRFLSALGRKMEFADVKRLLAALGSGSPLPDNLVMHRVEAEYRTGAWPDPEGIFGGTRYRWIDAAAVRDAPGSENRLDRQYYSELWESLDTLPRSREGALRELILLEATLQNLVWALRLRRYYGFGRDEASPLLAVLKGADATGPALSTFDVDIDDAASSSSWTWAGISGARGRTGALDLVRLEVSAQGRLHRAVRKALHFHPFTLTPLYCHFKLGEAEAAVILGMFEGIRLGAPLEERMTHAWALAGEVA